MIINMLDAMNIVNYNKKFKGKKRQCYVAKLQQWYQVFNNLGEGYRFYPDYIAVKVGEINVR